MLDYRDADLEVKKAIAVALDTPADVLQQLSRDTDASVRSLVASNPNTPTEILLKLGEEFPELITVNPIFNMLLLENPESSFVRLSLARSSTTSEETLARLSQTWEAKDQEICIAIANHPNTPIHILEKLAVWYPRNNEYYEDGYFLGYRVHESVALNIKTPPSLLEKLASHNSINIRIAVAKNQNTSPGILEKLAKEGDPEILQAVANNPKTPVFVLEQLAAEDEAEIRQAVLENPNFSTTAVKIVQFIGEKPGTPIHLLERLASDSRLHVRQLVADHPHTPLHVLEKLVEDSDFKISRSIANHPNISSEILEKLTYILVENYKKQTKLGKTYYEEELNLFVNLIQHPHITTKALLELASLEIGKTMEAIAKLTTPPPNILARVAQCQRVSLHFWELLSINPNTPSEILEDIFARRQTFIDYPDVGDYAANLASNPNLPLHLIEELAQHESSFIRAAIAANPRAPIDILCRLANDLNYQVVGAVAANENTPIDILYSFLIKRDSFSVVQIGLAKNVKTPITILERLADEKYGGVRVNLAKNISTPISILERLASDSVDKVRQGVTENPQTPTHLLELLANSPEEKIRVNIAKHPNASFGTLLKLAEDNSTIREALVERDNLPSTIIEKLVGIILAEIKAKINYSTYSILSKVGGHLNTPIPILEKLALNLCDEIPGYLDPYGYRDYILEAIAKNINTPISVLEKLANMEITNPYQLLQKTAKKALKAKSNPSK
ncbi:DUF2336 domain-containing protein [Argonema antarcticum]|uniref:DUF2336 domain-containing protein n=1 Tax=Argonema antarcticum TaxID=2942763 RepID=UPI0020136DED|nr:DUF2336 domain-containing protein [Argonema antarcticum]MCL1475589.1 DUF2336 domain-containing protein [Argonema antarcticum A004/B2]